MRSMRGVTGLVRGVGFAMGVAAVLWGSTAPASAQVTTSTFTYQGRLEQNGTPYSGPAVVRVQVFESFISPTPLASSGEIPVDVVDGLMSFDTDLGTVQLLHPTRFYQVFVKTPGMSEFEPLEPRLWRSTPTAGAAYRAMTLDSISTSADPFPVQLSAQSDSSNYEIAERHWQGFSSGGGGRLTQIALEARSVHSVEGATLRIYQGQGPSGTLIHTQKVFVPAQGEALLNLVPGIALQANQYYSWDLEAPSGQFIGLARSSTDVDPVTLSSAGGSDFAYKTFVGGEGQMSLRASRLGVNEGNPLAPLHVSSGEVGVARFTSRNIEGAALTLESRATPIVYQFKVHDFGNPTGDPGGQLSIERLGGTSSLWLHSRGLSVNTRNSSAPFSVWSTQRQTAVMSSNAPEGTSLALVNDTNSGVRLWELVATGETDPIGPGFLALGNPTTRVAVSSSGRVGIGILPATPLHVGLGSDASLNGGGYFQSGPSGGANLVMDDNEILARNNGAGSTLFLNAEGGGVAIGGVTASQATLHVQSGGNVSQLQGGFIQLGQSTSTNLSLDTNEIQVLNNGVPSQMFLNFRGGQVNVGESGNIAATALIVQGQALKPGGGSWTALSDRRAKTDIEPMHGTLDRLLSLHGYSFRYSDEALRQGGAMPGTQIGLMAQEVQHVFPDWVTTDDQGRLNVTERATTALMVESLRDLRAEKDAADRALRMELDHARSRVNALEAENAAMRERLERLERAIGVR